MTGVKKSGLSWAKRQPYLRLSLSLSKSCGRLYTIQSADLYDAPTRAYRLFYWLCKWHTHDCWLRKRRKQSRRKWMPSEMERGGPDVRPQSSRRWRFESPVSHTQKRSWFSSQRYIQIECLKLVFSWRVVLPQPDLGARTHVCNSAVK